MSPDKKYPEVNLWSVLGHRHGLLFSAAAAYLGLKVGQVFEAAIPIAIIAVGVSGAAKRKNALGENVIIQSIGASSGESWQAHLPCLPVYPTGKLSGGKSVTFCTKHSSVRCWGRTGYPFPYPVP